MRETTNYLPMYKTPQVKAEELDKIAIKNQEKITEVTGSALDLQQAWRLIEKASDGFSKPHAKAQQADALLAELMQVNGLTLVKNKDAERIKVRERERSRAIEIMKLKLQIAA